MNALVDRLAYRFDRFRWLVEGSPTQIISRVGSTNRALRRIGLRPSELDHAVRVQNGDDVSEVWDGNLDSSGHLVLTLRRDEQDASHGDIDELACHPRPDRAVAGGAAEEHRDIAAGALPRVGQEVRPSSGAARSRRSCLRPSTRP